MTNSLRRLLKENADGVTRREREKRVAQSKRHCLKNGNLVL